MQKKLQHLEKLILRSEGNKLNQVGMCVADM